MSESLSVLLGMAILIGAVGNLVWCFRRSKGTLQRWATAEGYELVKVKRRLYRRGPFWWPKWSGAQYVFRVLIRDGSGRERSGYVCVGGWFSGAWSNAIKVQWDEAELMEKAGS